MRRRIPACLGPGAMRRLSNSDSPRRMPEQISMPWGRPSVNCWGRWPGRAGGGIFCAGVPPWTRRTVTPPPVRSAARSTAGGRSRWAVRPVCAALLALLLFVSGAVLANTSSRLALFSVLGLADTQVWEEGQIDLAALRQAVENRTAPLMYEYSGPDALIAYDRLRELYPDLLILYSGYMDREGAMVFGCVESTFLIRYGAYTFEGLHSVVKVTPNGRIEPVTTADYDGYAPAVIALYETIDAMPRSS